MPQALTQGAITALLNAARTANTSAGWRSAQPFLAMSTDAIVFIDGADDVEFVPDNDVADDVEIEPAT